MAATAKSKEKADLLAKLEPLLTVAGTDVSWDELNGELRVLSNRALRALVYRVERARADAFEDGTVHPERRRDVDI